MPNKRASLLPWCTLIAMILGAVAGLVWKTPPSFFLDFSKGVIVVIKYLAMPLLFLSILDAIVRAEFKGTGVVAMLGLCTLNGLAAITIGLTLSNLFKPGNYLTLPSSIAQGIHDSHGWIHKLSENLQEGKLDLLTGTSLAIILAISLGIIFLVLRRVVGTPWKKIDSVLQGYIKKGLGLLFWCVEKVAILIPLAVFSSVLVVVGRHGTSTVAGLLAYLLACLAGMVLHIVFVYQSWIRFFGKIPLKIFWKAAWEPAIYGFGINSSLATLPMTLGALQKLKISERSSRLAACVGTNFNNDGILLYEVMAVLFLIQAYGVSLNLGTQLVLAFICTVATIGVAGIPEAGIISLTIVLSTVGLPVDAIPILLTVDWILARSRTVTNVLGDMTVAIGIEKLTQEKSKSET